MALPSELRLRLHELVQARGELSHHRWADTVLRHAQVKLRIDRAEANVQASIKLLRDTSNGDRTGLPG